MEGTRSLKECQDKFAHDLFATKAAGITIEEVGDGFARCCMKLQTDHRNAVGGVMGGAIFTLADFAFAVASNYGDSVVVSLNSQINFLSGAKGRELTAVARSEKEGKRTCYYTIDVTDELGTKVAAVTATGMRM